MWFPVMNCALYQPLYLCYGHLNTTILNASLHDFSKLLFLFSKQSDPKPLYLVSPLQAIYPLSPSTQGFSPGVNEWSLDSSRV